MRTNKMKVHWMIRMIRCGREDGWPLTRSSRPCKPPASPTTKATSTNGKEGRRRRGIYDDGRNMSGRRDHLLQRNAVLAPYPSDRQFAPLLPRHNRHLHRPHCCPPPRPQGVQLRPTNGPRCVKRRGQTCRQGARVEGISRSSCFCTGNATIRGHAAVLVGDGAGELAAAPCARCLPRQRRAAMG